MERHKHGSAYIYTNNNGIYITPDSVYKLCGLTRQSLEGVAAKKIEMKKLLSDYDVFLGINRRAKLYSLDELRRIRNRLTNKQRDQLDRLFSFIEQQDFNSDADRIGILEKRLERLEKVATVSIKSRLKRNKGMLSRFLEWITGT